MAQDQFEVSHHLGHETFFVASHGQEQWRAHVDAVSRCAAAPGTGTRRADRRGVLPYPPSPSHL
jgi:hypothetical protein